MSRSLLLALCLVAATAVSAGAQAAGGPSGSTDQAGIPNNPDSLFGPSSPAVEPTEQPRPPESGQPGSATKTAQPSVPGPAAGGEPSTTDAMIESLPQARAETPAQAVTGLLQSSSVQIGGYLFSDYTAFVTWANAYPTLPDLQAGSANQLIPNLEGDLFFDARPYTYFRVFGKFRAIYPFSSTQVVPLTQTTPLTSLYSSTSATPAVPNISVFELYADVNYKERVYFRIGQQVVNWGVGYFFSPADVISLTSINPLQPTLEREGPLALKMNIPFAGVDNFYFYVIANQAFADGGTFFLDDLAVAPKLEFVVGDYEIGLGAYYQRNQRPKAMVTATGSIFGKIGLFGEGVVSYGADRTLVEPGLTTFGTAPLPPVPFQAYTDTTTPYFSGTIGANYLQPDWHFSLFAQYYYNGQGYSTAALEQEALSLYVAQQKAVLFGGQPTGARLSLGDLMQPGRHYAAAAASWSNIRSSNVNLGLFYEGNFSDGSGVVSPSLGYTPFQYFTVSFAPYIGYGGQNTEFISLFGYLSLSLKVTIGEGAF